MFFVSCVLFYPVSLVSDHPDIVWQRAPSCDVGLKLNQALGGGFVEVLTVGVGVSLTLLPAHFLF